MAGREPTAVKLEYESEEVEAELALRIFLDKETPSYEERMLLESSSPTSKSWMRIAKDQRR